MHLLTLATGKTRDTHLLALEDKYTRRFTHPWKHSVQELKASTLTDPMAASLQEAVTQQSFIAKMASHSLLIALDERGLQLTSQQWATQLGTFQNNGTRQVIFLIGGAAGLTPEVRQHAHASWAISTLTLPHQLVRGVLAEQLYRAFTLLTGHPYHRE